MDWIRWTRYEGTQEADSGQMPYNKAVETLKQFGEEAKKTLDATGADHIVYGLVEYDKQGNPIEIGFYLRFSLFSQSDLNRPKDL